jgi:hypothetical protein
MKKIFSLIAFVSLFVFSQNKEEHISGFNIVSLNYKINEKWSVYTELQERSIEDFNKPDYYEIKGGVGYNFNKKNQAFIGLGRYANYTDSKISKEEFRIWLQYTYSTNLNKLKIDNRFRAEKRFFHNPISNTNSNDERYRYRLTATYPLNNDKLEPKTLYINAYDEVFMGPEDQLFKRNRIFGGFGYVFTNYLSSNLGYMWQRELSPSTKNLHFIYLGFNFTIDKHNKEADHMNVAD